MTPRHYRTHLTVLEQSATRFPDSPAFRVPKVDPATDTVLEWDVVTYCQFWQDVERFARHWSHTLKAGGVPPRSVVGLWYVCKVFSAVIDTSLTSIRQARRTDLR